MWPEFGSDQTVEWRSPERAKNRQRSRDIGESYVRREFRRRSLLDRLLQMELILQEAGSSTNAGLGSSSAEGNEMENRVERRRGGRC